MPYATAMLATGADPASVVDAVEALLGAELAPAARFMLGTALCERGASAAAEAQFRAVHECQPHSGRARVALAEVLLAQRRYAEAAELAGGVPVDDPLACAACRSELFARLVQVDVDSASPDAAGYLQAADPASDSPPERAEAATPTLDDTSEHDRPAAPTLDDTSEHDRPAAPTLDDTSEHDRPAAPTLDDTSEHARIAELAAVDVALERAAAAAVPAAELALFAAWRELAATGSAEVELPADAVGPLETILRALLLVQDFKHFESLVALLERTPLAARERSELLAQAYFDRGLPAAAAEEWLAICRVSPDVRALLGLARVAERQGLATEAADFARALLEREPQSRAGAELLARVSPAGVLIDPTASRLKFSGSGPITMRKPKSEAAHGWDREQCFQEENSMSSPIAPSPITAAAQVPGTAATSRSAAPGSAYETVAMKPSVSLDAIPSSPPPEVLAQMAGAARVYDQLSSQGRELRFARDEDSGRTTIEVRDRSGNVLKRLSPSQALDVAAGAPLE